MSYTSMYPYRSFDIHPVHSFKEIAILAPKSDIFEQFSNGMSRDHTYVDISFERLISRMCFIYEKRSVFRALSIDINFSTI